MIYLIAKTQHHIFLWNLEIRTKIFECTEYNYFNFLNFKLYHNYKIYLFFHPVLMLSIRSVNTVVLKMLN